MKESYSSSNASSGKRVTVVTDTFPPDVNGVSMTLSQLVERLATRGHAVEVVHPKSPASAPHSWHPGITFREVPGIPLPGYPEVRLGLPRALAFAKEWRLEAPAAIYVATEGMLGSSAASTARHLGIRVVSGYHTHFSQYLKHYKLPIIEPLALQFLRNWHNKTAMTLTPAADVASSLRSVGFENVGLLGRGVDCELYHPGKRDQSLRHHWGAGPETPVALCVGRVAPEKNLTLALQAYRQLRCQFPDLKLVMVGDGPARQALESEDRSIFWAGMQRGEALAAHYASADLFLFPSITETYGNVLVEAMASGLTTISYGYAASRQLIEDERNGFQAPFNDEAAFSAALERALRARSCWADIGHAARRTAETLSWESVTDTFERALLETQGPVESGGAPINQPSLYPHDHEPANSPSLQNDRSL